MSLLPSHRFPLNDIRNPAVKILLTGSLKDTFEVEAVVDTGFSGFLSVPMAVALKNHLCLWGTQTFTLADGRQNNELTCVGFVEFAGKSKPGVVSTSWTAKDALIGMEFLKAFQLDFHISVTDMEMVFTERPAPIVPPPPLAAAAQAEPARAQTVSQT